MTGATADKEGVEKGRHGDIFKYPGFLAGLSPPPPHLIHGLRHCDGATREEKREGRSDRSNLIIVKRRSVLQSCSLGTADRCKYGRKNHPHYPCADV